MKTLRVSYVKGCVNVSYLPDQWGFSVVFALNNVVLFNKTVSGEWYGHVIQYTESVIPSRCWLGDRKGIRPV